MKIVLTAYKHEQYERPTEIKLEVSEPDADNDVHLTFGNDDEYSVSLNELELALNALKRKAQGRD